MALLLQQQREQEELALPGSYGADKAGGGLSPHLASPTNGHSLSLFHNEMLPSQSEVLPGEQAAQGRGPAVSPFAGGLRARPLSLKLTNAEHAGGLSATPPDQQLQVGLDGALGRGHAHVSLAAELCAGLATACLKLTTAEQHQQAGCCWCPLSSRCGGAWLQRWPPCSGPCWHREQSALDRGDSEASRRCCVGVPAEPEVEPSREHPGSHALPPLQS